jgi:hypothetical protein
VKIVLRLSRRKAAFVYPVPPAPPTAILVPWFRTNGFKSRSLRSRGVVRVFEGGWDADAEAYQPAAIAGTWHQLESLLAHTTASPTHALIVLARRLDLLLTMEQRKQLWQAFRVPVFEQIIGGNGALLAAECEAHAGLHIESSKLEVAGLSVESGLCGCGRTTARIGGQGQIEEIRAAAAYAR